jgi:hypothetical protein
VVVAVGALALLASACGGGLNVPTSPSSATPTASTPSPAPPTGATPTASGATGTPTASPVPGRVTTGIATLTASGGVQTTQSMPLTTPAVYAPPPGTFVLNWTSAAAGFAMTGLTFVGSRPSSTSLQVSLSIHASSGTFAFVSRDGSCQITITTADPTDLAGSYSCPNVTDTTGTVTVTAQGTFNATG